jgi:CheY-like chemotaxis protein
MARVLVVDDHADTCRSLARLIRSFGHDAECIESGAAALARLTAGPAADLVILDVMMPGLNGIDVLRNIRLAERTRATPVVMFSAAADPALKREAWEAGANDWWTKAGLDVSQIQRHVERWVAPGGGGRLA